MSKAAFSLGDYRFEKVNLDFSETTSGDVYLDFDPKGRFSSEHQIFYLSFKFTASNETGKVFISIDCTSEFKFDDVRTVDNIPNFFYKNSIAILFPFIRAFVSTLTLQSNLRPLILPVMNLTDLEAKLKDNTTSE